MDDPTTRDTKSVVEHPLIQFIRQAQTEDRIITKLVPPTPDGPRYAGFYCQDYDGPTLDDLEKSLLTNFLQWLKANRYVASRVIDEVIIDQYKA